MNTSPKQDDLLLILRQEHLVALKFGLYIDKDRIIQDLKTRIKKI